MLGLLETDADRRGRAPARPARDCGTCPRLSSARGPRAWTSTTRRWPGVPALSAGFELTLYRIVQEALTNAAKHAPGAHVRDAMRATRTRVVQVTRRRPQAALALDLAGAGHGLVGMRERVALYSGTLHAGPDTGRWVHRAGALPADQPRAAGGTG